MFCKNNYKEERKAAFLPIFGMAYGNKPVPKTDEELLRLLDKIK